MSRGLPKSVKDNIEKCRSAAITAVSCYNSTDLNFKSPLFVILIIISWTALFHAIFYKNRKKPWYKKRGSTRYQYINGEPKHWDLSECLKQYYKDKTPADRKNIEFLIGLRNKIEHRSIPELDSTLYGECQASLFNLEELLIKEYGARYSLTKKFNISLQFSQAMPREKKAAISRLVASEANSVVEYIEKFRKGLGGSVLDNQRYSYNVFLVPRVANRANVADAAVEFINAKDLNSEELKRIQQLNVLIKEKHIPIANLNYYRPSEIVKMLTDKIPYKVNMFTHIAAWKYYEVRPPSNSKNKAKTKSEYCIYNRTHDDYLFTDAWVNKLIESLSNKATYKDIIGKYPTNK